MAASCCAPLASASPQSYSVNTNKNLLNSLNNERLALPAEKRDLSKKKTPAIFGKKRETCEKETFM